MRQAYYVTSPAWQEDDPGLADVYLRMDVKVATLVADALDIINPDDPLLEMTAGNIAWELRAIVESYRLGREENRA